MDDTMKMTHRARVENLDVEVSLMLASLTAIAPSFSSAKEDSTI